MADDDGRSLSDTVADTKRQVQQGKDSRGGGLKAGLRAGGSSLSSSGRSMMSDAGAQASSRIGPVQYHKGGKVRKTGNARLKKGERVIPKGKRKKVERLMKRSGMGMTSRGRK